MRYILFHADRFSYKTLRRALRNPPDPPGEHEAGPSVVVFVSIEKWDTDITARAAADDILDYALNKVREPSIILYPYAHLSSMLARPEKAHKILVTLENLLRERAEDVHRAPFGWYKRFEIHVKGHPLSELSRSIGPGHLVSIGGLVLRGEEDAARAGILLHGSRAEPPMEGLAAEKVGLLGLECGRWEGLHYLSRIAGLVERLSGERLPLLEPPHDTMRGVWDSLALLAHVLEAGPGIAVAGCPLESAVSLPRDLDPVEVLEAMGLSGLEEPRGEARGIFYTGAGAPVLVGLRTGDASALGPLMAVMKSVVHYQASRAGRGETPMLPVWLHPVTAALIPARREQEEYAASVARELAQAGASVVVLEPSVGVGARIRWAGKRWVPYVVVAGPREERTGTVTVRRRWRPGEQEALAPGELAREIAGALLAYGAHGRVWRVSPR